MDVSANQVTPDQLTSWMMTTVDRAVANQDEWCYALAQLTGIPCPSYDVGNPPTVRTTSQTFLDALRNYQLGINASTQGPGGSGTSGIVGAAVAPSPNAAPTVSMGLLGPTNCSVCVWLGKNPWILVLAAVAIYFAFFYKK